MINIQSKYIDKYIYIVKTNVTNNKYRKHTVPKQYIYVNVTYKRTKKVTYAYTFFLVRSL